VCEVKGLDFTLCRDYEALIHELLVAHILSADSNTVPQIYVQVVLFLYGIPIYSLSRLTFNSCVEGKSSARLIPSASDVRGTYSIYSGFLANAHRRRQAWAFALYLAGPVCPIPFPPPQPLPHGHKSFADSFFAF
jgi:hypothetical protein